MNRCRRLLLLVVGLVLGGMGFMLWSKKTQPLLRLQIVKQSIEQGKPVVFFRLDGDSNLRILIHGVEKVTGAALDGRYDSPVSSKDIWAPCQLSHWAFAGQDFGVLALTNVPIWKLRVTSTMSVPSRLGAFKAMPTMWSFCRSKGRPFLQIAKTTWNMGLSGYTGIFETNVIESDLITNSVPPESSSSAIH